MAQKENTNDVRQSERGGGLRILWICAISTGLAIVLAALGHWFLLGTPAEEARGDIPQAESPNTTGVESLPPEGGPGGG